MQNTTIAPALPEIDEASAAALGNEILLGTAKTAKVKTVKGASGTVRAWSRGGNVD